ncbi:bacteriophage antitermination protein Q [Pantoea agglomerans]|uniref:bacteriophage antitermination protein Q n=1 Tax=Enterobacter agglomerans TaxID=549 RepID=UPI003C7D60A0
MNAQALEFVRQTLTTATADLSGSTKGQLVALAENCMFTDERYPRKPLKVEDPETGKMITVWNQPVPGHQSRAKGKTIVPLLPVEYSTASWRRAILLLEDHHRSWISWCYGAETSYSHQHQITLWGWLAFCKHTAGKKLAKKTRDRVRSLVWLAAQDVARELHGGEAAIYQQQQLAMLSGVTPPNWAKNYAWHWDALRAIFFSLDKTALLAVCRARACQKSDNFSRETCKS